jgi:hypothetical protein
MQPQCCACTIGLARVTPRNPRGPHAFRRQAQAVPIRRDGPFQVVDSECQQSDVRFHRAQDWRVQSNVVREVPLSRPPTSWWTTNVIYGAMSRLRLRRLTRTTASRRLVNGFSDGDGLDS